MSVSKVATIKEAQQSATEWLFAHAAPLWSSAGYCSNGLFAERLTVDGTQVTMNRRLRVQARQIYAFCTIGKLGWDGPWRQVVESSLDILLTRGRREDGLFAHLFDEEGQVVDSQVDLYDHAFALFALAHAGHALERPDLFDIAEEVQNILDEKWARPQGGFWEGELTPSPPYRQNPHMHMFEAALAHYRFSGRERWRVMKDRLGDLFRDRFRDPVSGAVTEYFDRDWNKVEGPDGEIVEPGHCLEWAWLFEVGFDGGEGADISNGLVGFARQHGLSENGGVAINEVWLNGMVKDGGARLWPQTERLKAAVARYSRTGEASEADEIVAAFNGLLPYLDTPARGTWYDKLNADGTWVVEDAPASSFYHIVCAIAELMSVDAPR
jgi:mannose/cellobiose epimerase-like protein (N-acyl-D-glucosamine 2-epimerase family)